MDENTFCENLEKQVASVSLRSRKLDSIRNISTLLSQINLVLDDEKIEMSLQSQSIPNKPIHDENTSFPNLISKIIWPHETSTNPELTVTSANGRFNNNDLFPEVDIDESVFCKNLEKQCASAQFKSRKLDSLEKIRAAIHQINLVLDGKEVAILSQSEPITNKHTYDENTPLTYLPPKLRLADKSPTNQKRKWSAVNSSEHLYDDNDTTFCDNLNKQVASVSFKSRKLESTRKIHALVSQINLTLDNEEVETVSENQPISTKHRHDENI